MSSPLRRGSARIVSNRIQRGGSVKIRIAVKEVAGSEEVLYEEWTVNPDCEDSLP